MWGSARLNTWGLPRIASFAQAEEFYRTATKKLGDPTVRKLRDSGLDLTITFEREGSPETESYMLNRAGSAVVTYHRDRSITVHRHYQASTSDFANRMLPGQLNVDYTSRIGPSLQAHGHLYRFDHAPIRVRPNSDGAWAAETGAGVWVVPKFNPARGRASLARSAYGDFCAWAKAVVLMGGLKRPAHMGEMTVLMSFMAHRDRKGLEHVAAALKRPDRWQEIVVAGLTTTPYDDAGLDWTFETVRLAVYWEHKALTIKKETYIPSDSAAKYYRDIIKYKGLTGSGQ